MRIDNTAYEYIFTIFHIVNNYNLFKICMFRSLAKKIYKSKLCSFLRILIIKDNSLGINTDKHFLLFLKALLQRMCLISQVTPSINRLEKVSIVYCLHTIHSILLDALLSVLRVSALLTF